MADPIDTLGDDWLEEVEESPAQETEVVETEVATEPEPSEGPAVEETPEEVEAKREKFNPVLYREAKDERAARQAVERERDELRRQLESQPKPAAQRAPDPYEDPVGYNDFVQAQVKQTEWNMRAEMSGRFAEQKYGKEKVDAAVEWAREQGVKDPYLGPRVQSQASPVEFVVEEYERSLVLQTLSGKGLDAYVEEQIAARAAQGGIVSQPAGQPVIQKPASPPRSLASAPNAGGNKAPANADWGEVKFALDS